MPSRTLTSFLSHLVNLFQNVFPWDYKYPVTILLARSLINELNKIFHMCFILFLHNNPFFNFLKITLRQVQTLPEDTFLNRLTLAKLALLEMLI